MDSSSRCVLYDEIGAKGRALLEKDFVGKTTFEATWHPAAALLDSCGCGVSVGARAAAAFNRDGSVTASLAPAVSARGAKLSVDVSSAKARRAKAALAHTGLLPGLRVGLSWALGDAARFDTAYRHRRFALQGAVAAAAAPSAAADAALRLGPRVVAGAAAAVALPPLTAPSLLRGCALSRAEGRVAYAAPRLELTAYAASVGRVVGVAAWGRVGARTTAAVDVRFDTTKTAAAATAVEAGVMCQIDAASCVKAKVGTDCVVAVSYVHQLSRHARAVFTGTANAANLSATGNHTVGFSLVLSD